MKNFITIAELAENMSACKILDCRGHVKDGGIGVQAYEEGHIPGASYVNPNWLSGHVKEHGGRCPLPYMSDFAMQMEKIGVKDNDHIVIYDDWIELGMAGRLWWMFKYMGMKDVKILIGGIYGWKLAGRPLTKEKPEVEQGTLTMDLQENLYVEIDEVKQIIEKQDRLLVDARAKQRYLGAAEPLDPRPGHIPTAKNLFFKDLFTADGVKSTEEIEALVAPLRETGKETVMYCGSGISAPLALSVMNEVGIEPVLYIGSMSDWLSYEENPVAVGEEG